MRIPFSHLQKQDVQRDVDACAAELCVSFVLVALVQHARKRGQQKDVCAGPLSEL
jgi:hypothetical protein